mmetsp:Transcript_387/g.835  ORF Transcript_387/g.835 Transcript_387/m.835 type:complete len:210 (-) Transcript_387:812-1441(-)
MLWIFQIHRGIMQINVDPYARFRYCAQSMNHKLTFRQCQNFNQNFFVCPMMRADVKDSLQVVGTNNVVTHRSNPFQNILRPFGFDVLDHLMGVCCEVYPFSSGSQKFLHVRKEFVGFDDSSPRSLVGMTNVKAQTRIFDRAVRIHTFCRFLDMGQKSYVSFQDIVCRMALRSQPVVQRYVWLGNVIRKIFIPPRFRSAGKSVDSRCDQI